MSEPIIERAPAKINLYLHITEKRADGYHMLESLAVFAETDEEAADIITLTPGGPFTLEMDGPYAEALKAVDPTSNLICKALNALEVPLEFTMKLTKNLPIASGIGGGSADAGAALRAAASYIGWPLDHEKLHRAARVIGADGYMCFQNKPAFMRGIGDELEEAANLPRMSMLLVNPNIPLPTADVYKKLDGRFSPPLPFKRWPADAKQLAFMLGLRGNDLQKPAVELCAPIQDVLDVIGGTKGCMLARLSGSGATCFGLYADDAAAQAAAEHVRAQIREWWVATTSFGG